jgi:hypothetical protein
MRLWAVILLAKMDGLVDEIAYRPAVVRALSWSPAFWSCQAAKLSIRLDKRWATGYWTDDDGYPGPLCEACGRRASNSVVGGWDDDLDGPRTTDNVAFLDDREVPLCGWCFIAGEDQPILNEEALQVALRKAKARSTSWTWRWRNGS